VLGGLGSRQNPSAELTPAAVISVGKQPHYFTTADGTPILTIAGLWDEWKNKETGELIMSCAMIISAPNDFVAEVHDRMPVLLAPDQFDPWLKGEMDVEDLKPAPTAHLRTSGQFAECLLGTANEGVIVVE
jgi:putative SOS response-associated peptidase YedK